MRLTFTLAALLTIAARVNAADGANAAKQLPSDETIINLCGDSLANMFAKCGEPEQVFANASKMAILDYGAYGFSVEKKTVTVSYFFDGWKGTIKGVKFGDTKEHVVEVLGKDYSDVKGKTFQAYGWELKEPKATFWLYFDDDGKVSRVQITQKK